MPSPDGTREVEPTSKQSVRAFLIFSLGSGISFTGIWAQRTAMGWLAWELTHSVAWVGALALTDLIAAVWVAPLAGAVLDRSNPYRLLYVTEGAAMFLALLLCLASACGWLGIYGLLLFALIDATLRGFSQPTKMMVPGLLAPVGRLSQAVAMSAVSIALAISIGPALAGIIMHYLGSVALVFAFNALSFTAMFGVLFRLRRWLDHAPQRRSTRFIDDMREGLGYVARTPEVATIFLLTLGFSFLARPFAELLPAFVGQVFDGGPGLLSMLMSAQGGGAFIGALLMLRQFQSRGLLLILYGASFGIAAALLVFVSSTNATVALMAIATAGLFHVACNIAMQSLCQLRGLPSMRGRIMALYGLVFRVGPAVGAFCIAQAGSRYPIGMLVGGCVIVYVVIVLGVMLSRRRGDGKSAGHP